MQQPPPLPCATARTQRQHPRVDAGFPVKLKIGDQEIPATARDLSMAGLFLDGPISWLPDQIGLSIPIPGLHREIQAICRVQRREAHGVGLSFAHIEWEDLLLMAKYVAPRL